MICVLYVYKLQVVNGWIVCMIASAQRHFQQFFLIKDSFTLQAVLFGATQFKKWHKTLIFSRLATNRGNFPTYLSIAEFSGF